MSDQEEYIKGECEREAVTREMLTDEVPQMLFATRDVDMIDFVKNDPDLKGFQPLLSHLIRLTKTSDKEKKCFVLAVKAMLAEMECEMDEEDYNGGKWLKIESTGQWIIMSACDSNKGYKFDLLTRSRKEVTFQPEKKKKGLFS